MKTTVWNDAISATGSVAARVRGEPSSFNLLTDDEVELRDRAWRYLVPARERPWFDRVLAELVATRIIPAGLIEPDRSAYFRGLLQTAGRSPTSSYRKLSEDASADLHLIPSFVLVASRVLQADRLRAEALMQVEGVTAWQQREAKGRIAENRCLVAWVVAASGFRHAAYRYALDHLFIEAPGLDAVPTEDSIRRLGQEGAALHALGVPPLARGACAADTLSGFPAPSVRAVLSRKG